MEDNVQQRLRTLNLFLTGRWYQWLSSKSHSHPESLQDKSGFGAWETWKKQPWRRWSWGMDPSKPKHFAHIHAEKAKNLSDGASWCSKMSLIFLKFSVWQQEKRGYLRYLCVLLEVWSLCVCEPLELDIKVLCRQTSARETLGGGGGTCVFSWCPPSSPLGVNLQRRRLCRADIKEEFAPSACLLYAESSPESEEAHRWRCTQQCWHNGVYFVK